MLEDCAIAVEKLAGPFGARITGADLRSPADRDLAVIAQALRDEHVVEIVGQALDAEHYLGFVGRLGRPVTFFNSGFRVPGHDEMFIIKNPADFPEESRNYALHWHCDTSYEIPPVSKTFLYGIEAPDVGNETLFADLAAAYDALDARTKAQIDGLRVVHRLKGDDRLLIDGERRGTDREKASAETLERDKFVVDQPLVLTHPETGRKGLYAVSGSAVGIVGMSDDEGIALLRRLKIHSVQPRFVQQVQVKAGSLVIWDNLAVMHCATPTRYSDEDGERRLIYGVRTRDLVNIPLSGGIEMVVRN